MRGFLFYMGKFRSYFKHIWYPSEIYFLTTKTYLDTHFLVNEGACQVVIETLRIAKEIYGFELYSFIIMPDHLHLLIANKGEVSISRIMHYIKRNSSRNINALSCNLPLLSNSQTQVAEDDHPLPPILGGHIENLSKIKTGSLDHFSWQQGFHDRRVRDNKEFDNKVDYINIKNLFELVERYGYQGNPEDYPFYTYTNPEIIDEC